MVALFIGSRVTLLIVRRNQLKRRKVAAKRAEQERYVDYTTVTYIIGRLVESIFGERSRALISGTQGLLDQFVEMCPEGKKDDLFYDRDLLQLWLTYNMANRLMNRDAELHWPPKHDLKPPWFKYSRHATTNFLTPPGAASRPRIS